MNQNRHPNQETEPDVQPANPANAWLEAARSLPSSAPATTTPDAHNQEGTDTEKGRPVFVGAHGGAGTTAWAGILDGTDAGHISAWDTQWQVGSVVLVLRASLDGVTAAKNALATQGADSFTAALVVAAGPGRAPRRITDELRILAGAVPLARAPWVQELLLKRAVTATPADLPVKELTKLTTTLANHGVDIERKNK